MAVPGYADIPLDAPITYAFRMYRNYDGAKASSATPAFRQLVQTRASWLCTRRSAAGDGESTVIMINKTGNNLKQQRYAS